MSYIFYFSFLTPPASSEGESEEEGGWREDQEGQAGQGKSWEGEAGETQEEPTSWHQHRSRLLYYILLFL